MKKHVFILGFALALCLNFQSAVFYVLFCLEVKVFNYAL